MKPPTEQLKLATDTTKMGNQKRSKKPKPNVKETAVASPSPLKKSDQTNVSSGITKTGSVPKNFVTSSSADVAFLHDYEHVTLFGDGRKKYRSREPKGSGKGYSDVIKSKIISSAVEQKPVIKHLEKGFDLWETRVPPACCMGRFNYRDYAHGFSSGFSSPRLVTEAPKMIGNVDFISDWNNIKTLFKAHGSECHLSYLLHRVGDSVTIDQLDFLEVALFKGQNMQLPPDFVSFVSGVVGVHHKKIFDAGKSNKEVMAKETFHKLLHLCMKRQMVVNYSERKDAGSSDNQFLHHALYSTPKFKILGGSNTPIYLETEEAFPRKLTVRSIDGQNASTLDLLDIWLDNTFLDCPNALLVHHKGTKIIKTDFVPTEKIPNHGKFNALSYIEHGEKLLEFIRANVAPGNSYWLYRAPESFEICLYNISKICAKPGSSDSSSNQKPIFADWTKLEPYLPYFGTAALYKYSECFSDVLTERLILEMDPKSATGHGKNQKQTKNQKLELLGGNLKRCLVSLKAMDEKEDWILLNADRIHSNSNEYILECIKRIYACAIAQTPNLQTNIYRHAVERYFPVCLKLLRTLGQIREREKVWQNKEDLPSTICNILECLVDMHEQVTDLEFIEKSHHPEWHYLACRMIILHADTLDKMWEPSKTPPDMIKHITISVHERILGLYKKALDKIPDFESFQLNKRFSSSLKEETIKRQELLDEVNKNIVLAYLGVVRCLKTDSPSENGVEIDANQSRKTENGRNILLFDPNFGVGNVSPVNTEDQIYNYLYNVLTHWNKVSNVKVEVKDVIISRLMEQLSQSSVLRTTDRDGILASFRACCEAAASALPPSGSEKKDPDSPPPAHVKTRQEIERRMKSTIEKVIFQDKK